MLKSERLLQVKSATDFLRGFRVFSVCGRDVIHVDDPSDAEIYMREVSIRLSFAEPIFSAAQRAELLMHPSAAIVFGSKEQEDYVASHLCQSPINQFYFVPQKPNWEIH